LAAGPIRRANTIRQFRYAGTDIGERQLRLWGGHLDRTRKEDIAGGIKGYFNNIRFLSAFDMSDEAMNRYAYVERSFKPSLIVAYPSALALLSNFCKRKALKLHKPKVIITSGEMLYPEQREIIEEVFSAPVFNRYGSRQFSNIASECKQHKGMHVASDLFFVEIIHKSGKLAKSGEMGELVVTDLSNYYMPFIRYRTGDFAVSTDRACDCGRGLPLLEKIEGRSFDTIRTPEGKSVGGSFWTRLSRAVPGINRFQIEQKGLNGINFRIVPGPEWKIDFKSVLEEKIKANCGDNFNVTFLIVDDIPLAPSGKSRFIIPNIEEKFVIKSKIHKANITAVEPDLNDCLRIDGELMELADIAEYEKVLIVDATNGVRLETFAVKGPGGKGEIVACGAIANKLSAGDEIGVMAFTWSRDKECDFSNILVDRENRFERYLTEVPGQKI
jgi:phenylacetate-CoA ligase